MATITPLNRQQPLSKEDGKMTSRVEEWQLKVSRLGIIRGVGSPEGVVPALEDQLYKDSTGGPGANLYIKNFPDIGGNDKFGWELT